MKLINRSQIPDTGVSHDPMIRKKVLIKKGRIPKLTNFSQSTIKPGQCCPPHQHPDMWEVYLVESGIGMMILNGEEIPVSQGDCLIVDPGEDHSMRNPSSKEDLLLTYFGIEQ
ncbi:MAG: cupin domain-containing protein [Verrucomicrobiaceae bacterium]|nr:cupin domain-containing protein [Verrucomicrobiaceae bacterium]